MTELGIDSPAPVASHLQPIISYTEAIAHGYLPDHWPLYVAGFNPGYGTVLTDISELGVATIPLPAAPVALEVISTVAADDVGSTGVEKIMVHGLDANWDAQSEEIEMNGVGVVAIPGTWMRVHLVYASQVGSGGKAAGIIKVRIAAAGAEHIRISVGQTRSQSAIWTVPHGMEAFLSSWYLGIADAPQHSVAFVRANCDPVTGTLLPNFVEFITHAGKDQSMAMKLDMPMKFPEYCDIKVAIIAAAAGNLEVSTGLEIFYELE